jgi:uncharacterized membrane protein
MGLVDRLKTGFVAGLVLVAPLFVTIVAFQLLFSWSRGLVNPIVTGTGLGDLVGDFPYVAEALAIVFLVLFVTLLGYLAQRSMGAYVFDLVDRGLARVPVFSVVYTGVRQVSDALTSQQSRFERVAMLEYPRDGLYTLGFVTGQSPGAVESETGGETYNVYVPGSPNPTQGKLLLVPENEITELDMPVSHGLRLLVTTGIAEERAEMEALSAEVGESSEAFETAMEELEGDQR